MSLCLIASNPQDELELKQLFLISQELKKKEYKFFILTNQGSRLSSQARQQGNKVVNHTLDGNSRWLSTWKLKRLLAKNQVKLVHFFDQQALGSSFKAACKAEVAVKIASYKSGWSSKVPVNLLSQLEAVICENEELKKVLLRNNIAANLEVIPLGIDFSKYKENGKRELLRKELNLSPDNFLVGLLSPFEDLKIFKSHLEAARILQQEAPRLKVIVLGQGGLNLERLKQEQPLELDNLYFYLGFNDKLADLMPGLDLFVFGSFALPEELILKAMVWKVPVIGVMAAGRTELIIHRETGFLVPPNDPGTLAQTILKLYLDRRLAQELSRQAYDLVSRKYSGEAMAQKMINYYEFLALQKGVKLGR